MNQNLSNQHFEKFLGQRLRFRAIYDGVKINHKISPHKKYYKHGVIFKRVLEVSSGDEFRDHVHIQVKESVFNKNFKDLPVGEVEFEFTAELYEYLQPLREHQDGLQYKTWSIGLRDLKKLEKVKSKGEKDNADHLSQGDVVVDDEDARTHITIVSRNRHERRRLAQPSLNFSPR